MTPSAVRTLTTRMASGDPEAFAAFYREWFDRMLAEARSCTGRDESFCLDVVQNAMLRVIRAMRVLDDEQQLRAWCVTVVRRCALDMLRAESRRRRRERARAQRNPEPLRNDDRAIENNNLQVRADWLRAQLSWLDPERAGLLRARFGLNWTLAQIANWLGVTVGTIDGRISRTLAELRRNAEEDLHE